MTESGDFILIILCGFGAARSESKGTTVYSWLSDFSEVRIIMVQWDLGAKALVNSQRNFIVSHSIVLLYNRIQLKKTSIKKL